MSGPIAVRDTRDSIRVHHHDGTLAALVDGGRAHKILESGCFRPVRRRRRVRALVPLPAADRAMLAALMRDLEALQYDNGISVRPGRSHMLETYDNPRGVVTISRIPTSLREIFTSVVDSCSRGVAA